MKKHKLKIIFYRSEIDNKFRWRMTRAGKIIACSSESYNSRRACNNSLWNVVRCIQAPFFTIDRDDSWNKRQ